jgi:VIT1/CCC1 family predicted Fe2+/Mn2+ transporter
MGDRVERDEEEQERLNRQLLELLNEVRVAVPGVQVLFAFLLTVPFQQGFRDVTQTEKHVYLVTLLASAVATAFLIAPTSYHRLLWQRGLRPQIIRNGARMLVAGLTALAVAITGAVFLVVSYLFADDTAYAVGLSTAALFLVLWFGLPLVRRLRDG